MIPYYLGKIRQIKQKSQMMYQGFLVSTLYKFRRAAPKENQKPKEPFSSFLHFHKIQSSFTI